MPGSYSDYLENKLLDHWLGGPDYSRPATVYLALFTVAPDDAGAGGTEVSGGSYARLAVTNNATNFPAAAGGSKSNALALTFATASADWGIIVSAALYDAAAAGNFLAHAPLLINRKVRAGDAALFPAGSLIFTNT